ncbi:MAG: FGGY-family carbohydrate kinase, partial [Firmicutes bacterium]|nr:FGGY-family carbohydrate kinase [Bacillota bacterium]
GVAAAAGGDLDVVLCASHDTASAVTGFAPAADALYVSSGTWSLLGVMRDGMLADDRSYADNFTNEGAPGGGYRYQKNIMGMWLIQSVRKEMGNTLSYAEITDAACGSTYGEIFDVDDARFMAPKNMTAEIKAWLTERGRPLPETDADLFRTIFNSLAKAYDKTIREIERNTGRIYNEFIIAGGGANNRLVNELSALYTGKKVTVIPQEMTAIGNLAIQASMKH